MFTLEGKTCLVTGATGGIGEVTAKTLARGGARVIVHTNRKPEAGEALARALGNGAFAMQGDLGEKLGAATLFERALAEAGSIDVLVNNAATMPAASIESDLATWQEAWERTMRVDLFAPADLCREALRHFVTRGGGVIVNIASRAAFRGETPDYMPYASAKAGLVALTRSIARGFGKRGVLAYAIAPGFVDVEKIRASHTPAEIEAIERDIPLGAMADAGDVANLVAFLASGAARHATGTTIDVNGASYVR